MKVVLVYAADLAGNPADYFLSLVPVGLPLMAANLNAAGFTALVANLSGKTRRQQHDFFRQHRPEIVAFSIFTHNRVLGKRLVLLAKQENPACWVICGGPHATFSPAEVLGWPGVDAVACGEGEELICTVAEYRARQQGGEFPVEIPGLLSAAMPGTQHQEPSPRYHNYSLDDLPFAHYGLVGAYGVDPHRQAEFLVTSRGCPAACSFCASPGFWGKRIRYRSAASLVRELMALRDELGLLYFSLRDDTFTADRRRVIDLCQMIVDQRLHILWNCQSRVANVDEEVLVWLKRAGCDCIQFGIESGSPRVLGQLMKGITPQQMRQACTAARKVGLQVSVYLIVGVAGENEEDLLTTEELLAELLPHDGQVSPLAYYPGTKLFSDAVAAGRIPADIFATSTALAHYVRNDSGVQAAKQRLLQCLQRLQPRAAYRPADFAAQKHLLGYCHATSLQAGDYYTAKAEWGAARREYAEIIRQEPVNPWGWLALGELQLQHGEWGAACASFREVRQLVPRHFPALLSLAEAEVGAGNLEQARHWLDLAEQLAPLSGLVAETRRHLLPGPRSKGWY